MKRRIEQFAALGQEDRLDIFRLLVRAGPEGRCVDEIKRRLKLPGSTLSHHLDTLTRSGLLAARRSGRFIYHTVNWREASGLIRFLIEDCADAKSNSRDARRSTRPIAAGEGNGRSKFDQGTGQRALRARG